MTNSTYICTSCWFYFQEFRAQEMGNLDHRFLAFYINNKYGAESARSILLRRAAMQGRLVLCCDNIVQAEKDGADILAWLLYLSGNPTETGPNSSSSGGNNRRHSQNSSFKFTVKKKVCASVMTSMLGLCD
jgi:hypothetical protein